MTQSQALDYVSFGVDDALAIYDRLPSPLPAHVRLVGWQCGFEPMFVAVWSYLGVRLDAAEAEDIAADALLERGWFADGERIDADYIL
jgi:hypothetical protein